MKKRIITTITIVFLSTISSTVIAQATEEEVVKKVLKAQTTAWNKGDIEGYMQGYWNSDSLLFIGKNGPKYGYKETLQNYKKSYPDTATMGKLNLEILQMKRLSVNYFFVVGKWYLKRTIGDVSGSYTLLVRKVKKNWVIVADHSS